MIFNKETGTAHGRGFNEAHPNGGFLENFMAWVVRAPVASPVAKTSGGPGWYIIDDQSGLATDPYIIVSNHTAANVAGPNVPGSSGCNRYDDPHKIIQVGLVTATAGYVYAAYYSWWDASTQTGYNKWAHYDIQTLDDADFAYWFGGGPEMMVIASRLGTNWDFAIMDQWVGDPDLTEPTTAVGVLQAAISTSNPGFIAGDTDLTIQLASGEASNFTESEYCFIYDLNAQAWINYVKIVSIDTYSDTMVIDISRYDFPINSVIASCVHRQYTLGNDPYLTTEKSRIPYCSMKSTNVSWTWIINENPNDDGISIAMDQMVYYLSGMDPKDNGKYTAMRWGVAEYTNGRGSTDLTDMNRGYGPAKNTLITSATGIAQMVDGRLINSLQYIYADTVASLSIGGLNVVLIPKFNSVV